MYFHNELLRCRHFISHQTSKNEQKRIKSKFRRKVFCTFLALLSDIFLKILLGLKVKRPFARSGHIVQNYIYWWESCTVGLSKQCTCLSVYSHGRKIRSWGTWIASASGMWIAWASGMWIAWASGTWIAWASGTWIVWASVSADWLLTDFLNLARQLWNHTWRKQ